MFTKETNVRILGLDQIKEESLDGDFTAFYTYVKRKKVLHHNAGEPAFITSQGKKEYHILGSIVSEESAKEFGDKEREKYKQSNIQGF